MYSLTVRDHFMIAHSFQGEIFGPAQRLHGATYVVEVTFRRPELDEHGLVVDIGKAGEELERILEELDYRNLDEVPEFEGRNTTTEYLARVLFDRMAGAVREGRLGHQARGIARIEVILRESHVAWGGYEGAV